MSRRPDAGTPRAQGDEGSVLLIAIGFVLLFGLLAGSLLDATTTGLRETGLMHVQRTNIYTAEAGVQAAVQRIKNDFVAHIGQAQVGAWDCAGAPSNLGPTTISASTSGVNGIDASVTCTSGTTSTLDTGGRPPNAIMTIGGGLTVDKKGTALVGGNISSGGGISVTDRNGVLNASGYTISAKATCTFKTGSLSSHYTPTPSCKTGTSNTDPGYIVLPASGGAQTPPACTGAVVTFAPGVYSSSTLLNSEFNGAKNNLCTGKSFVFSPGVYVFDFPKNQSEWKIADQTASIVAGAPGSWTTSASHKPPIPGGCVFDSGPGVTAGTTFVFRNGSRLNVDKGHFEICAPNPGSGGQRVAIAGDTTQSGKIFVTGDKATVTVRGTVYAPKGDVQINSSKAVVPVLTRGVVARSVKISADVFNVQVVQLPSDAAHAQTDAVLQLAATIDGGDVLDAEVLLHNDAATGITTVTTTDWEVHA